MEFIGLQHFNLESYNEQDDNHAKIIKLLNDDEETYEFFFEINYMAFNYSEFKSSNAGNEFYVAFYDEVPIGVLSSLVLQGENHLGVAIIPSMRGLNLSSMLLKEFSEHLFLKNPNVNNVYVQIHPQNIGSIKNALKAGFQYEEDTNVRYVLRRK